jgi:hypothetical protein
MGSIHGTVVGVAAGAAVRLVGVDAGGPIDAQIDGAGGFETRNVAPGWYILSVAGRYFLEAVNSVHVEGDAPTDAGSLTPLLALQAESRPVQILTVCEALENRETIRFQRVVIVGIFKSGMDETLRMDCPFQLVTGEVGWPSSIGLTRPSMPPDALRDEIEKKRQEILKSGPPGAQPRPERVVGLYGILVVPSGLTKSPCCAAPVETALPPARLFGFGEKDLRVIR